MHSMKILALVLAGGKGTRLHPLTEHHAKPALPFADGRRIVDFVLSNLFNSGITSIYLLAQHKPRSLSEHIQANWADRLRGCDRFIRIRLPEHDGESAEFKGTAHAVLRNIHLIEEHRPDLVVVFAADHVYRMDIRQMVGFHLARNADVTIGAVPVPLESASSLGVVVAGADGEVLDFQEKPKRPAPMHSDQSRAYASMGNYLFEPELLIELLVRSMRQGGTDFGAHILPGLPLRHRTFAYDFSTNWVPGVQPWEERCYWRDVGTLDAYRAALQDVTGAWPRFELNNSAWPIRGERRLHRSPIGTALSMHPLMAGPRAGHPGISTSREEGIASWR
ncbi:MAG: NTP transferase domain-containing protein [Betaproteobacteria bacterium]|nr:NTP transferase domain-containing protein [Betaproteobacteria bacterium]